MKGGGMNRNWRDGLNHRGGWALVKATWTSWLQYRSFFFVLAFGWMIPPLISLFIWSAAAGANGDLVAPRCLVAALEVSG